MAHAWFPGIALHDPLEVTGDLAALERPGIWAAVVTFEGEATLVRFGRRISRPAPATRSATGAPPWPRLDGPWASSMDEPSYRAGVKEIRRRVAAGTVYQVNLCRVMSHPLPADADLDGLAAVVEAGNPAPYAARVCVPQAGVDVVCASPEAFVLLDHGTITSRPIKGTASTADRMLTKDYAENVMICDLVRNDLSRVCRPGTVSVTALCARDPHPGLVHLTTTVSGRLRAGATWADILAATFPPGSVSGAPKSSALTAISDLEPVPRGPYCGAVGYVDSRRGEAVLAVGIRTFWAGGEADGRRRLMFGTGAGITWGSDPAQEWAETELKAARLVPLASTGSGGARRTGDGG